MLHAIVAVFRLPPLMEMREDDPVGHALERDVTAARGRFLQSTDALRQTADRVCRRLAGVNGFDRSHRP